jgi:hypothetical protein
VHDLPFTTGAVIPVDGGRTIYAAGEVDETVRD